MFGLQLHPAVVHYPIALGVVGAAALLAYAIVRREWMRWFGPILLTLALAGSGVAYFTGESSQDGAERAGVPMEAISRHEETAVWSIGLLALATLLGWASSASRRGVWMAAPIAVAAAALTLWSAHLGGRLVFVYGAGHVPESAAQSETQPRIGNEGVGEKP